MKRIIFSFILAAAATNSGAQDGFPTLTKDWLAEEESLHYGCSYVRSSKETHSAILYYSIKESQKVEDIKYSKMFIDLVELSELKGGLHEMLFIDEEYPGDPTCTDVLLIWQYGGKVYCQSEDATQEWLILDFSLNTGDSFVNSIGECYHVVKDSISDESNHKIIKLISEDGTKEDTWEEGIGSLQWGFLPNFVVKTLKYYKDVDEHLYTYLWAAGAPYYFMSQNVNDDFFILKSFEDDPAEDMTYEELNQAEQWLTFSFIGDSLQIQGYYPLSLYPSFIAARITGTHIDISIHQIATLDMSMGRHIARLNARIAGFKAGTYEVGMPGREYVTLECFGTNIEPVTFTAGQMATIILPVAPDADKGRYYRLDRCEEGQIIFEEELQPRARVPYIIVPGEDFGIDPSTLDLAGLGSDTVSIDGIRFIGVYDRKELSALTGGDGGESFYIDIIDTTPDCASGDAGTGAFHIGALRAFLQVTWDDPIDHGGSKVPEEKMQIVLKDNPDGIEGNEELRMKSEEFNAVYDLSGRQIVNSKSSNRKLQNGIYIEDGKKKVKYVPRM